MFKKPQQWNNLHSQFFIFNKGKPFKSDIPLGRTFPLNLCGCKGVRALKFLPGCKPLGPVRLQILLPAPCRIPGPAALVFSKLCCAVPTWSIPTLGYKSREKPGIYSLPLLPTWISTPMDAKNSHKPCLTKPRCFSPKQWVMSNDPSGGNSRIGMCFPIPNHPRKSQSIPGKNGYNLLHFLFQITHFHLRVF